MTHPTAAQLINAAAQIERAQQTEIENRFLKAGIKATPEEMDQIRDLAELASKSGAPSAFLSAVANITHKPIFAPCGCWWCRLKRWLGAGL